MSKEVQLQTSPTQPRDGGSGHIVRHLVVQLDMLLCLLEAQDVNKVARRVVAQIGVTQNGVAE